VVTSALEQFRIADFIEWSEKKQLILNPDFQRQSVWPPAAKSYLIDTILRKLPIPKIYMRTKVDVDTRRSVREVVDGQQRLRTIIDFGSDRLVLGPRAREYAGSRYSSLTADLREAFLTYPIAVDQLINASDADVLEVFARLNSYTVPVNAPELRHAKYQGDFKWAVHDAAQRWTVLWDDLKVLSKRERVRLLSDSLMAEMFGILVAGVEDGGQKRINLLYDRLETGFNREEVESRLDVVLSVIVEKLGPFLRDTSLVGAPHFLMLFAAAAHATGGIPRGELIDPPPPVLGLASEETIFYNLARVSEIIRLDEPPKNGVTLKFWQASKSSTQRIGSRRVRFPVYVSALQESEFRL
jgi:Protein of unknown function DUF262